MPDPVESDQTDPRATGHHPTGPEPAAAVVFDLDGTLLDSAPGIVAGFAHALRSVGFGPPSEAVLRSDLGPPVNVVFTSLGLGADRLEEAVAAYRRYYLEQGLQQSRPYPGVVRLLDRLTQAGIVLGTATAKRTEIARAIVEHHRLSHYFAVNNGSDDQRTTKTATLDHTLHLLGRPGPARTLMVGDRHSDLTAASACGVVGVGVTWGYGSVDELRSTGAPHLVDRPDEVAALAGAGPRA